MHAKQVAEANAIRAKKDAEIARQRRSHSTWSVLTMTIYSSSVSSQRAMAAVKLQRLARERKWNREQTNAADVALARTMNDMERASMYNHNFRFGPQRARLMRREQAYQAQFAQDGLGSSADDPKSLASTRSLHMAETADERARRREATAMQAHRCAMAAQASAARRKEPRQSSQISAPPASVAGLKGRRNPGGADTVSHRISPSLPWSQANDSRCNATYTAPIPEQKNHKPRPPSLRPSTAPSRFPRRLKESRQAATGCPPVSVMGQATAHALHRCAWVQTPRTRVLLEIATAEALRPSIARMDRQSEGGGSPPSSVRSLAHRACDNPPSTLPEREHLSTDCIRNHILLNPRLMPHAPTANQQVARVWMDTSLATSHIKMENAALAKWRAERRAWLGRGGLRRKVVIEEESRSHRLQRTIERSINAMAGRMVIWQREDDAALQIQFVWRHTLQRRKVARQAEITLKIRGIRRLPAPQRAWSKLPQVLANDAERPADHQQEVHIADVERQSRPRQRAMETTSPLCVSQEVTNTCRGIIKSLDGALASLHICVNSHGRPLDYDT